MVQLTNNKTEFSKAFLYAGLGLLSVGMIFGFTGSVQYILPGFLKEQLSFEKLRPLHVSSVVFWIITAAMGPVLTYLQEYSKKPIRFPILLRIQFYLFVTTIAGILISYVFGVFGGREYWEFHPLFALPIIIVWLLFLINFLSTISSFKKQPVYVWMWLTGLFFFLFTYIESYLWLFPFFQNDLIKDMTVQWKSYGSMVGSWNMLVYGSSIYLMDKIAGNKKYSFSKIGFALYFLGLFNLMFNWGHHIYTLPTSGYIKHIAYGVSMTELLLLGRIIYLWRKSLSEAKRQFHLLSYRFLVAADVWVFLTLGLAIAMSVPAFNVLLHGTYIVVGHTMGATIGINSMLLLAFVSDILRNTCKSSASYKKMISIGYWTANISLVFFWLALIAAGIVKGQWQMSHSRIPFGTMIKQLTPYLTVFVVAGFFLLSGFLIIVYQVIKSNIVCYNSKRNSNKKQVEQAKKIMAEH